MCQVDGAEVLVRTKLARTKESLAVCVAEAICHPILEHLGFRMAEKYAVVVGEKFADDLTAQYGFDAPVMPGRHWGTRLMQQDVQEVEFADTDVSMLHDPGDIFRLFLADVVIANEDRGTYGNILLATRARSERLDIIPIDQSDAFHHPSFLLDRSRLFASKDKAGAKPLPGTEPMIVASQPGFVEDCFSWVRGLRGAIVSCATAAANDWYRASGIDPAYVEEFLNYRVDRLDALASRRYWEGIQAAAGGGGLVLDF